MLHVHQRRLFLAGAAALMVSPLSAAVVPPAGGLLFAVRRDGRRIGWHEITLEEAGDRLRLGIEIALDVRWGPLTLYRYRHRNREEWRGGVFERFASETDDDGTRHRVRAERGASIIRVESGAGLVEAPLRALPSTYWCSRFLDTDRWIDTQSGRLLEGSARRVGVERLAVAGGTLDAERWRIEGDLELDLWYRDGRWVKMAFEGPDGSALDYELQEPGAVRG